MSFLLDTNICSAHFRRPAGLSHQFIQYSGRLFIPNCSGRAVRGSLSRGEPGTAGDADQ